ncbi:MAG: hypothetical protein Q9203_007010, partial [Teloschistes exilis]
TMQISFQRAPISTTKPRRTPATKPVQTPKPNTLAPDPPVVDPVGPGAGVAVELIELELVIDVEVIAAAPPAIGVTSATYSAAQRSVALAMTEAYECKPDAVFA